MEGLVMALFNDFFRDRRVLITGHTGFKGSWLTLWLHRLGAQVTGVSLEPAATSNLFNLAVIQELCTHHIADIRDAATLANIIQTAQPEIVLHLAAQPLVRASYRLPLETFSTNVMGSANLLEALRGLDSVRSVVMVTTDKVYHNREWCYPYREDDALGGHDPYSASKGASELVIASYRASFLTEQGVAVATARAGNVIGGGDWSEDRLIPDAIRAWQAGSTLEIRHPDAVRPWQHVLEPLYGYLRLAQAIHQQPELAGSYNFGPEPLQAATVRQVIALAQETYRSANVYFHPVAPDLHEASLLMLDSSKSRSLLGIYPRWSLTETVRYTMNWYYAQQSGVLARMLCEADINAYESLL